MSKFVLRKKVERNGCTGVMFYAGVHKLFGLQSWHSEPNAHSIVKFPTKKAAYSIKQKTKHVKALTLEDAIKEHENLREEKYETQ